MMKSVQVSQVVIVEVGVPQMVEEMVRNYKMVIDLVLIKRVAPDRQVIPQLLRVLVQRVVPGHLILSLGRLVVRQSLEARRLYRPPLSRCRRIRQGPRLCLMRIAQARLFPPAPRRLKAIKCLSRKLHGKR